MYIFRHPRWSERSEKRPSAGSNTELDVQMSNGTLEPVLVWTQMFAGGI